MRITSTIFTISIIFKARFFNLAWLGLFDAFRLDVGTEIRLYLCTTNMIPVLLSMKKGNTLPELGKNS